MFSVNPKTEKYAMSKSNTESLKPGAKRGRERALPSPNALAWTILDYQAMGGPGKTTIYNLAKAGKLKLFEDGTGRTMVDGDSGRALLGMKADAA
jgi:hypothetical protein